MLMRLRYWYMKSRMVYTKFWGMSIIPMVLVNSGSLTETLILSSFQMRNQNFPSGNLTTASTGMNYPLTIMLIE